MIPRTFFSAWIGIMPPKEVIEFAEKTERMHAGSGWKFTFHGPSIYDKYANDPYVRRMMARGEKLAYVMDRIRLLMLKETGGFWVDCDSQFKRPMSLLDKIVSRQEVDFLTGIRNPHRPPVALHRGVALIDNTVMGSAPNGRMVNKILALYSADYPMKSGHDCGCEVLRSIDESVVLLNYERFYVENEAETPNTILRHDGINFGSWAKIEIAPLKPIS
jgi:hypothetical protein